MPLTQLEQQQVQSIIDRDGGLDTFIKEVTTIASAKVQTDILSPIASVANIAVSDWLALQKYLAKPPDADEQSVILAATASITQSNLQYLFPQLVTLLALRKSQLGL